MSIPKTFSSKTYVHSVGLSCCFRQWRAKSHCRYLHGYALQIRIEFGCSSLDMNGWVQDFGGLKSVKEWLADTFDHKLLVAKDDPDINFFKTMESASLCQLTIVEGVGAEAFSRMIFSYVDRIVKEMSVYRVFVSRVEVNEHQANSAFTTI